jgi:hypothetical protein
MSDETQVVEAPAVEKPVEKIYEYQATDEQGRPLGGKQVIKYKTEQELIDKLAQNHTEAIRLNRKLKQDHVLGNKPEFELDDSTLERDDLVEFKARELTADERFLVSQDPSSPQARKLIFESEFGASPDVVRNTINRTRQDAFAIRAGEEAKAFLESTPEFYACQENSNVLMSLIVKHKLAPTKTNFWNVYQKAKAAGLLLEPPTVTSDVPANTQPEDETSSRITAPESSATKRQATSSGLNRTNSSASGDGRANSVGKPKVYSPAEQKRMSAEEFKQKVLIPQLAYEAAQKRRGN